MKTININSNITINWKIWRGVNKVEEDFVGSNLRVFLIGTENTYYLVPNAVGGVLTMTIAPGTLAAGSYDLKAIWEKNGGRTLMSSTRSSIFGITETEAPERYEEMNIVSYVESYGRDGLSAYEIAVLRGLNRGCRSEAEWINSLYAGGEGGGGGICMLGTDITIGGTALGDDLLSRADELEGHLNGNVLDGGTPLNLLFKVLLSKAKEILRPENVEWSEGSIDITRDAELSVTTEYIGNRPTGHVRINVTYNRSETAGTPPEIKGLEFGYKTKDGTIVLDEDSVRGDRPSIIERSEPKITVKVNENTIEKTNGEYTFTPTPNNSSDAIYAISVEVDEGEVVYSVNELFVWPLDNAERVYDENGVTVPAKNEASTELKTIKDTASYTHKAVGKPKPSATPARASYSAPNVALKSITPNLKVGDKAEVEVTITNSTLNKTAPQISGLTYGYKKNGVASENTSVEGTINAPETQPDVAVELYNNGTKMGYTDGKYSFTVVEGENKITAKYFYPTAQCSSSDLTVTPLNEDGFDEAAVTAKGFNDSVGGGSKEFGLKTFDVVLPAKLIMAAYDDPSDVILNTELQYAESGFDITDNENKEQYANLTTTEGASDYPWTVLIPKSRENATIAVWKWNRTKWTKAAAEFELKDENYIHTDGVTYRKYFSEDNTLTKADMCVKVII